MNVHEETFGDLFRRLRRSKGFKTQKDLAAASGVSQTTLSRIEDGTQVPQHDTLKSLAKTLNVKYIDLMEMAGYFEGLDEEDLQSVKDFFEEHRQLDEEIEKLLRNLYSTFPDMRNQIKEILLEYSSTDEMNEFGEELGKYDIALKFIKFIDADIRTKIKIIGDLKYLIKSKENPVSVLPRQDSVIELSTIDNFILTFHGRELSPAEASRVKEMLVAALTLKQS